MPNEVQGRWWPWMISVGLHTAVILGVTLVVLETGMPAASEIGGLRCTFLHTTDPVLPFRKELEPWIPFAFCTGETLPIIEESEARERRLEDRFDTDSEWWLWVDDPRRPEDCPNYHHHCRWGHCRPGNDPWWEKFFGNFTTTRSPWGDPGRSLLLVCRCQDPPVPSAGICPRCLRPQK